MPTSCAGVAKCAVGRRSGDSELREGWLSPGAPHGRAVPKPQLLAPAASGPGQPQGPEGAEHEEIRRVSKFGSQFVAPQKSQAASQSPRTHPGRSPCFALFSYQARGIERKRYRLASVETVPQFRKRRPLGDLLDLCKQVAR